MPAAGMVTYRHGAVAVAGVAQGDPERLVHGPAGLVDGEPGAFALGAQIERRTQRDGGIAALGCGVDTAFANKLRRAMAVGGQNAQITRRQRVESLQHQGADDGGAARMKVALDDRPGWAITVAGLVQR